MQRDDRFATPDYQSHGFEDGYMNKLLIPVNMQRPTFKYAAYRMRRERILNSNNKYRNNRQRIF